MIYAMDGWHLAKYLADKESLSKIVLTDDAKISIQASYSPASAGVSDSTAVIPVKGVLTDTVSFFDILMGTAPSMTYSQMSDAILGAADDPSVKKIVLDIDSPGGDVDGLYKAVDAVRLVRGTKPIKAVVSNLCASAAYHIAAQADTIEVKNEAARVGSVGVKAIVGNDESVTQISSTDAPDKIADAKSDEGIAKIRATLDSLHGIMAKQIAEGRGVSVEKVNSDFGRGGVLIAKDALAAGMVDKVYTSPKISKEPPKQQGAKGAKSMFTKEELAAQNPELLQALLAEGKAQGEKRIAELTQWKGISAAADKVVDEAIASGKSVMDVMPQLIHATKSQPAQAAAPDAPKTQTSIPEIPVFSAGISDRDMAKISPYYNQTEIDQLKAINSKIYRDPESGQYILDNLKGKTTPWR